MSSMADFASALQGGGPPPGPPPDMGAPPAGPGDADLGAPPDDTQDQGQEFSTSLEALDAAEDAIHAFIQLDPDEADRAEGTKALQIIIKLKASNQDSANAGDLSSLQRALQGGPGAVGGPVGAAAAGPPPGGGY